MNTHLNEVAKMKRGKNILQHSSIWKIYIASVLLLMPEVSPAQDLEQVLYDSQNYSYVDSSDELFADLLANDTDRSNFVQMDFPEGRPRAEKPAHTANDKDETEKDCSEIEKNHGGSDNPWHCLIGDVVAHDDNGALRDVVCTYTDGDERTFTCRDKDYR